METPPKVRLEVRSAMMETDGSVSIRLMPLPAPGAPRAPINYGEPGILLTGLEHGQDGLVVGGVYEATLTRVVPAE